MESAACTQAVDAPSLVLLHGWGLHGGYFEPWAPYLIHALDVHRVDLPAHGHSPEAESFTLPALVHQLEHTLQRVSNLRRPFILLGWSMGGAIALEYALTRPEQVSHLVLLASSPKFQREPDWPHAPPSDALATLRDGMLRDYEATIRQFLSLNLGARYDQRAHVVQQLISAHPAPRKQAIIAGYLLNLSVDFRLRAHALRTPLLAISGRLDRLSWSASSAWLAARSGGVHRELPHAAHAPHLSHPEETANLLLEHLGLPLTEAEAHGAESRPPAPDAHD